MPVMIITGASQGIGAATARLAALDGWDVCINYLSNRDGAEKIQCEVHDIGRRAITIQVNIAEESEICRMFSMVDAELGPISALVNNAAAIGSGRRRVDAMKADEVNALLRTNVTGTIICAREAIRRMSKRQGGTGGVIINVSSASARLGAPNLWMDYAASKGAIDTLTMGLAAEIAEDGIRVNAVRPGLIDTEIHYKSGVPNRLERTSKHIPMKRPGTAEEVGNAIVWLASDAASYVSGAILDVAGAR